MTSCAILPVTVVIIEEIKCKLKALARQKWWIIVITFGKVCRFLRLSSFPYKAESYPIKVQNYFRLGKIMKISVKLISEKWFKLSSDGLKLFQKIFVPRSTNWDEYYPYLTTNLEHVGDLDTRHWSGVSSQLRCGMQAAYKRFRVSPDSRVCKPTIYGGIT